MPSSSSFSGALLALESIQQVSPAILRVRFTDDPLAASTTGTHDALNPANYTVTGPSTISITAIGTVGGDPQAVDITFAAPLIPGSWTVTVANIQTATGNALTPPVALSIVVIALPVAPPLSQGAVNDDAEALLRKFLSPALRGPGWDALIAGLATADTYRSETAQLAFDQLFKTTASGIYLDRRAADDGFVRPANIGISDDVFRKVAIKTTAFKQIEQVMLDVLEAYYGSEATRAFVQSTVAEPYALRDGDTLIIQTEANRKVVVLFAAKDFNSIAAASAIEVSVVINRALLANGLRAYAAAYLDPSTRKTYVRVFSGALGMRGYVRVYGGRAQNLLAFPTAVHAASSGPQATTQFTVTAGRGVAINGVAGGTVRFTFSAGTDPVLQDVLAGDYVNMYGSVVPDAFKGTYTVTGVSSTYFEISNGSLLWPATITLTAATDVRFYRPTNDTIQTTGRMATVTRADPTNLNVILPATTQAVSRTAKSAAYLHAGLSFAISGAVRDATGTVTLTTATPHGLNGTYWAFVDGLSPTIQAPVGMGWADADATANSLQEDDSAAAKLNNGNVLSCGGWDGITPVTTARLYTPSNNTWTTIPAMTRARRGHTATVLRSGKVLVVGGESATKICELYDPGTNTWTDTGATVGIHEWHSATLLNDGRVFVFGGGSGAEVYDPTVGTWSLTAQPVVTGRTYHTATLLNDGRVLIAGGVTTFPTGLSSAEVYNPINNIWKSTGAMGGQRFGHKAALIRGGTNGLVIVAGGSATGGATDLNTAEVFDPATLTWASTASMTSRRYAPGVCVLDNGQFFVSGGYDDNVSAYVTTSEVYDPINKTWSVTSVMSHARYTHAAIPVTTGKVLLVGGNGATPETYRYAGSVSNAGRLNGLYKLSTTGLSTLTYVTPDAPYATTTGAGTISLVKAETNAVVGPFLFDAKNGVAITGTQTVATMSLSAGQNYTVLTVADASSFPDAEGWLCFGFGTSTQVTPVRYLARLSSNQLLVDPSFAFPIDVPSGASVILLKQRGSWLPDEPAGSGAFYITAAAAGRVAASKNIDDLVAAGIKVTKTVIYPSDVGLGNAGRPASGVQKLSDKIVVWGGDELDQDVAEARSE
jgi:N-acetylneuraminic acid mutarotase